jgi:hypothetical protein
VDQPARRRRAPRATAAHPRRASGSGARGPGSEGTDRAVDGRERLESAFGCKQARPAEPTKDHVVGSGHADQGQVGLVQAIEEVGEGFDGGGVERADPFEVEDEPLFGPRIVQQHLLDARHEVAIVEEEQRGVVPVDEQARAAPSDRVQTSSPSKIPTGADPLIGRRPMPLPRLPHTDPSMASLVNRFRSHSAARSARCSCKKAKTELTTITIAVPNPRAGMPTESPPSGESSAPTGRRLQQRRSAREVACRQGHREVATSPAGAEPPEPAGRLRGGDRHQRRVPVPGAPAAGIDWPTFLTADFDTLVPLISISLSTITANALILWRDPKWLKATGDAITAAVGFAVAIRVYQVFPFDFSAYAVDWSGLARLLVVLSIAGTAIGCVINLVKALSAMGL